MSHSLLNLVKLTEPQVVNSTQLLKMSSQNNADLVLSTTPPNSGDRLSEYAEATEMASTGSSNPDLNQSSFSPTTTTDNPSEYAPISADEEDQLDPTISFEQHLSEGSEEVILLPPQSDTDTNII